jgi:hypothetical protein
MCEVGSASTAATTSATPRAYHGHNEEDNERHADHLAGIPATHPHPDHPREEG